MTIEHPNFKHVSTKMRTNAGSYTWTRNNDVTVIWYPAPTIQFNNFVKEKK